MRFVEQGEFGPVGCDDCGKPAPLCVVFNVQLRDSENTHGTYVCQRCVTKAMAGFVERTIAFNEIEKGGTP